MLFKKKETAPTTITSQIRINRCSSCGQILQTDDPKKSGYISPNRLEKHIEEGFCNRCYNLRHFNASNNNEFNADYIKILNKAKNDQALIVYVLDLFSFEPSLIPNIGKYLPDNLIVILNKRDILGPLFNDDKLISDALKRLKVENIIPRKILLFSSITQLNITKLFNIMNEERKGKDVYFIGASLVGKSSIVTEMLRQYVNNTSRMITTKQIEGTYLDVMEIPLDENSSMYDTPGIFNPNSILNQLERNTSKYIVPREEVNLRKIILSKKMGIIAGAIFAFTIESGEKTEYTFRVSNAVDFTIIKLDKLEKTFNNLIATNAVKPISEQIKTLNDLSVQEVEVPNVDKEVTLVIFGLLRITFKGIGQKFKIYLPKNVAIKLLID